MRGMHGGPNSEFERTAPKLREKNWWTAHAPEGFVSELTPVDKSVRLFYAIVRRIDFDRSRSACQGWLVRVVHAATVAAPWPIP